VPSVSHARRRADDQTRQRRSLCPQIPRRQDDVMLPFSNSSTMNSMPARFVGRSTFYISITSSFVLTAATTYGQTWFPSASSAMRAITHAVGTDTASA
jgi:hypothetical protein